MAIHIQRKYLQLTICFLFIINFAKGQNFESVFGNNTTYREGRFCQLTCFHKSTETITKTIINGVEVHETNLVWGVYYRENEDRSKVWVAVVDQEFGTDTIEYLLLDFTLSLGDSFYLHPVPDLYQHDSILMIVDSVYYLNGRKHIRFDYQDDVIIDNGEKLTFIEGIGTNLGLFYFAIQNLCPCVHLIKKDGQEVNYNYDCYANAFIFNISDTACQDNCIWIRSFRDLDPDYVTWEIPRLDTIFSYESYYHNHDWQIDGDSIYVCFPDTGLYKVILTIYDEYEIESDTLTINVWPKPTLKLQTNISIGEGDQWLENLPQSYTYIWLPNNDISCNDCNNPIFFPAESTEYILEAYDSLGCRFSDTVSITVLKNPIPHFITAPNAFSPNKDGVNDFWEIEHKNITDFEIKIYTRWGINVFTSKDPNFRWDGNFKGSALFPGVYSYFISGRDLINDEEVFIRGNVSLIR